MQRQTVVTAYLKSKQLLLFVFARHFNRLTSTHRKCARPFSVRATTAVVSSDQLVPLVADVRDPRGVREHVPLPAPEPDVSGVPTIPG